MLEIRGLKAEVVQVAASKYDASRDIDLPQRWD